MFSQASDTTRVQEAYLPNMSVESLGGISSSVLSVFFTDKFYKLLKSLHLIGWEQICQWKTLTKCLMKCPPEGRYCSSKMFRWEPEGHYCCTKSMAIAPFWFSTNIFGLQTHPSGSQLTKCAVHSDLSVFLLFLPSCKPCMVHPPLIYCLPSLEIRFHLPFFSPKNV